MKQKGHERHSASNPGADAGVTGTRVGSNSGNALGVVGPKPYISILCFKGHWVGTCWSWMDPGSPILLILTTRQLYLGSATWQSDSLDSRQ